MPDANEPIQWLRRMPVFGGLNNQALQFLLDQSQSTHVVANDYFFREDDAARALYVLTDGAVVVEKRWEDSLIMLGRYSKGDCFGEMAIIDLQARSASVRADSDCQAIEITRATLHELYRQDLEQYCIIMMNMGREVSRRLRTATERLFAMTQSV